MGFGLLGMTVAALLGIMVLVLLIVWLARRLA